MRKSIGGDMSFETTDWELEAKRVQRAFGIEEECVFKVAQNGTMALKTLATDDSHLTLPEGRALFVYYDMYGRRFFQGQFVGAEWDWDSVRIDWDGVLTTKPRSQRVIILARGLFHLGLLTPQVEDGMNLGITAHQKLEWRLQYEVRYETR